MKFRHILGISFMILIMIIMIFSMGIIIYAMIDDINNENYCNELGYDSSNSFNLEPGYIECCNKVYVNHKEEQKCEILKEAKE